MLFPFVCTLTRLGSAMLLIVLGSAARADSLYGATASINGVVHGGAGQFSASNLSFSRYSNTYSSASLADGKLHSFSSASQLPCLHCGAYGNTWTTVGSRATFWDTVTFHNGQNLGLANLFLTIDGTATAGAAAWLNWYTGDVRSQFFANKNYLAPTQSLGSGVTRLDDDLVVPYGDTTVFVYAELTTQATGWVNLGSVADYGNTLRFGWTLPEGVTYTSASGLFMSQAAAVPEAGTHALMLAGLLAITFVGRRRAGRVEA